MPYFSEAKGYENLFFVRLRFEIIIKVVEHKILFKKPWDRPQKVVRCTECISL